LVFWLENRITFPFRPYHPFTGSSESITDITSAGSNLKC